MSVGLGGATYSPYAIYLAVASSRSGVNVAPSTANILRQPQQLISAPAGASGHLSDGASGQQYSNSAANKDATLEKSLRTAVGILKGSIAGFREGKYSNIDDQIVSTAQTFIDTVCYIGTTTPLHFDVYKYMGVTETDGFDKECIRLVDLYVFDIVAGLCKNLGTRVLQSEEVKNFLVSATFLQNELIKARQTTEFTYTSCMCKRDDRGRARTLVRNHQQQKPIVDVYA